MTSFLKESEATNSDQDEDLVSLLNPDESLDLVIKVNRVYGLAPFVITKTGKLAYVFYSHPYGIYSVALAFVVGTATVFGALHDLFEVDKYTVRMIGTTTIYVTIFDFGVLVASFVVNSYHVISRKNCYLSILSYFNQVDILLGKRSWARKNHYAAKMFITIALSSILFGVDYLVWYFNTSRRARKYMVKYVPAYILQELLVVMVLQYWIMVDSIKRRVRLLKQELWSTGKQLEVKLGKDPKIEYASFTRTLAAYQCIFKAVQSANELYGLPILVFLFNVLLHEIIILYYWLEEVLYYHRVTTLVWALVWIICYGYILVLTVNGPHAIATECQHISAKLAELLALDLDQSLRAQLNTFSAALVHQPIKFSAKGLLDVDRTIITSMTAVITTYIVVLMQYSAAKHMDDDDD